MSYELADAVSFLLSRIQSRIKNIFLKKLKQYQITPEQWVLLARLSEQEGISLTELSYVSLRDKPYTTRLIDKLADHKLIFKEESPDDRRSTLIYLTWQGAKMKEEIIPVAEEINEWLIADMKKEEVEQLKSLLHKMYENIQSHN